MKEIPLTQGQVALIDDSDYELLNQWMWHALKKKQLDSFYAARTVVINGKSKYIYMHRYICGVTDPKIEIDHIDHNGLNNQRNNLRVCSNAENSRNKIKLGKCSSIYKGVYYCASYKRKWQAHIMLDKKSIHLGYYDDEHSASVVYDLAAIKFFKEFARTNHPIENYIDKDLDSYFTKRIPTSRFTGVCWNKTSKKWVAAIRINGKRKHIGSFTDEIDAAKAFDNAAMIHYGSDYPRFNFP